MQAANTRLIGEIAARQRAEEDLIKQRDRLEEMVQERTRELVQSNRDLEQFAGVASHDLQEPLRNVQGFLQLLERRYKGKLDANADDFIRFAVEGATRMSNLISDLLAYSRVGTMAQRLAPTDCNLVLDQALANLHQARDETNALITHDPLPVVEADAAQLVQLFQNLIGNALKFRGDRRPEVHVSAHEVDGRWQFSVQDKGIGIPQDQLERIFVIFQRLHLRDEYPGTGIGLAVCKRIVERHNGRIWAESEPGQGSTFCFTI